MILSKTFIVATKVCVLRCSSDGLGSFDVNKRLACSKSWHILLSSSSISADRICLHEEWWVPSAEDGHNPRPAAL